MKIARIETFLVPPRWLFVRVETDEGVVGWGEPIVEGRAETVRTAIEQVSELLIGQDPARIEDLWQLMTKAAFYRGGPVLSSAAAGLDQALWDIAGKTHGVPVHTLLGGHVRDRIRMYGWIHGDSPEQIADSAQKVLATGLTAVKLNGSGLTPLLGAPSDLDGVIARVSAVREVLGRERDIAIDLHGRFTAANTRRLLPELEPLTPLFVEEPVTPENSHLLGRIVDSTSIPIATGERLFTRQEFLPVLQAGVAVVQPDLSHAGGISEVRRIASLAETFGALIAPHCPLGPLALAASLQIGFAVPNYLFQEQSIGIEYHTGGEQLDYVVDGSVFDFSSGYLERLTAPGLGITIDEEAVRAADKNGHAWRTPLWRHPDGSLAEW